MVVPYFNTIMLHN